MIVEVPNLDWTDLQSECFLRRKQDFYCTLQSSSFQIGS